MTITSVNDIAAGMTGPFHYRKVGTTMEAAGVWHSLFYATGNPGPGVAPSSGMAGAALTSVAGQLPFIAPGAGNKHVARFSARATVVGTLMLVDRLWDQSGIVVTTTGAQTINSATWPARDLNGATAGVGVMVGLECSTATTNGAAVTNMTLSYTPSTGGSPRNATMTSWPQTAQPGTFVPFELASGDSDVGSVQSITLGTSFVTGAVHLVAYRILGEIEVILANTGQVQGWAECGLARCYDGTTPFLIWVPSSTSAVTLIGSIGYTEARSVRQSSGLVSRWDDHAATEAAILSQYIEADAGPVTEGSGVVATPAAGASGTGVVVHVGSGTTATPTRAASGAGSIVHTGSATATTPTRSASGSGVVVHAGAGTAVTPTSTASGSGTLVRTGAGVAASPSITAGGAGLVVHVGAGFVFTPITIASGTGARVLVGSGEAICRAVMAAGTGIINPTDVEPIAMSFTAVVVAPVQRMTAITVAPKTELTAVAVPRVMRFSVG